VVPQTCWGGEELQPVPGPQKWRTWNHEKLHFIRQWRNQMPVS
jgi:hypothetical protein